MRKKENKKPEGNFTKFLKAPVRLLIMARDAYVRSMTSCSARLVHGGTCGFGLPAGNFHVSTTPTALPRIFSLNPPAAMRHRGGDDDYRRLVRAASARTRDGSSATTRRRPRLDLGRNYSSLVIGRIDEEKPCDFGDEDLSFEKCKSYSKRKKGGWAYKRFYNKE